MQKHILKLEKKNMFFLIYGHPDGTAVVVVGGARSGRQELVPRIEYADFVYFVQASVIGVGPAFGDDIDVAGHAAAHDGRSCGLFGGELLDGVVIHSVDESGSLI